MTFFKCFCHGYLPFCRCFEAWAGICIRWYYTHTHTHTHTHTCHLTTCLCSRCWVKMVVYPINVVTCPQLSSTRLYLPFYQRYCNETLIKGVKFYVFALCVHEVHVSKLFVWSGIVMQHLRKVLSFLDTYSLTLQCGCHLGSNIFWYSVCWSVCKEFQYHLKRQAYFCSLRQNKSAQSRTNL